MATNNTTAPGESTKPRKQADTGTNFMGRWGEARDLAAWRGFFVVRRERLSAVIFSSSTAAGWLDKLIDLHYKS